MRYCLATIEEGEKILQDLNEISIYDSITYLYNLNLDDLSLKELLCYLLENGYLYFYMYLIGFHRYLSELDYQDLLEILEYVAWHKKLGKGIELLNLLESVYMILGIDLISVYAQYENIDSKGQQLTLQDYYERPGVLCREEHIYGLEQLSLTFEDFKEIQNKLVSQGAIEAEIIEPDPHIELKGRVKIFTVQGKPPTKWMWINQVKENWINKIDHS